jgi:hypothetical protein
MQSRKANLPLNTVHDASTKRVELLKQSLVTRAMLDRGLDAKDYEAPACMRYRLRSNVTGEYKNCVGYCCEAKSGIDADAVIVFADNSIDCGEWEPVSVTAWHF